MHKFTVIPLSRYPVLLLILGLALSLSACGDDAYESRLRELLIDDLSFDCGRGTQAIVFRNEDVSAYDCLSSETWCEVAFDVVGSRLVVNVSANDTYDVRTATVTLGDRFDASARRSFTVTQARNVGLFVDKVYFEVPQEGGSATVSLKSNVGYEVQIPADCDWVTLAEAKTRGLDSTSFTLLAAANTTYRERTAVVTVMNTTEGLSDKITLYQPFTTVFRVDSTAFEVPMEGGTFTVNVESNIRYDVRIPSAYNWIEAGDEAPEAVVFTVKENKGYQARDAVITLCNDSAGVAVPVTVHQPFTAVFKADQQAFEVPMEGGTVTVNMESNVGYEVVIPEGCGWITQKKNPGTRGVQQTAVVLEVKENKGYRDREATVSIENKEAGVAVAVTVSQPFEMTFKADNTSLDAPMEGGTVTVNMTSNIAYDVVIPADCDWITLAAAAQTKKASRTRGTTTTPIALRVKENKSYQDREATVTIQNKEAGAAIAVTVHQPFETTFKADNTTFDVPMEGGAVTVNLTSNISYDVGIPADCDWITLPAAAQTKKASRTRGVTTTPIVLRVKENPGYKDRDATITISNKEAGAEIKVSVHQPFTTVFKADNTAFDVPMDGGTVTVNMEANVAYDVSIPAGCDWITQPSAARGRTRGTSQTAVVLRVKANDSYKDRDAVVTISNRQAGVSTGIYIHQPYAAALKVDKTDIQAPMEGGTVMVNVESNVDYRVSIPSDCGWISMGSGARTRGTKTSVVVLRVARNTTERDRSTVVTVGNQAAGVSAGITITQPFAVIFSVDTTPLEVDELGGTLGVSVAANVGIDVTPQASWLKAGKRTEAGDGYWTQQITVARFTEKAAERTSGVKFLYGPANQSFVVPVTQRRTLYISESALTLTAAGQEQTLSLQNSRGAGVVWTSSDTGVATVSASGVVTAVGSGDAVITVKSSDGQYSDKVKVNVTLPPPPAEEPEPDEGEEESAESE